MKSLACEGQKGRDRISPVCYLGYFLHQEGKSCRVPGKDCPVPLGRLTAHVSWLISVVLLDFCQAVAEERYLLWKSLAGPYCFLSSGPC